MDCRWCVRLSRWLQFATRLQLKRTHLKRPTNHHFKQTNFVWNKVGNKRIVLFAQFTLQLSVGRRKCNHVNVWWTSAIGVDLWVSKFSGLQIKWMVDYLRPLQRVSLLNMAQFRKRLHWTNLDALWFWGALLPVRLCSRPWAVKKLLAFDCEWHRKKRTSWIPDSTGVNFPWPPNLLTVISEVISLFVGLWTSVLMHSSSMSLQSISMLKTALESNRIFDKYNTSN